MQMKHLIECLKVIKKVIGTCGDSQLIQLLNFEARDTRSGSVASELLIESQCEYLISDVFSGYKRAVKDSSEY